MKKIQLNLYASLSRFMPEEDRSGHGLELAGETTVREVLVRFNVPLETVKMIFINGRHAGMDAVLNDGDRVGVFPPVAGG
ncbi:MAG: MoaD/ThiS family protein [Deltaproteobacteria bacterium]|nr:MoaD/ThiS family protein [Deltaproteobacteria bacterium]MBW1816521.1 MoaD/ThiS family protein [Deltaproteobacteria bacterium]